MANDLAIRVRPANEEDVPFIFNSWLKSYRNSFFARDIHSTVYYSEHHKVLEKIIKNNSVLVACNPEESNQIYGYIISGKVQNVIVVHYVYVKQPYRNLGIAKLLGAAVGHDKEVPGFHTHTTRLGRDLAIKFNLIYSPYLALSYDLEKTAIAEPKEDASE